MARGRDAARAARRREEEANETAHALRLELKQLKETHHAEVEGLKEEIRRLRAEHLAEANRIAEEEITRKASEVEQERRNRKLQDDLIRTMTYNKDKFVRNACRYISMTKGMPPGGALPMVITWMTDADFYGLLEPAKFMAKLGLPTDGWVRRTFVGHKNHRRMQHNKARDQMSAEDPLAISLDHAEEKGVSEIHPDYNPKWYPDIQYGEMDVVDDTPKEGNR